MRRTDETATRRAKALVVRQSLLNGPALGCLLGHKYALAVVLTLYERGAARTTELVRGVGGHPATVIETLLALEDSRIVHRSRSPEDRRVVEVRLTMQGLELVETAMSHWLPLLRKWNLVR